MRHRVGDVLIFQYMEDGSMDYIALRIAENMIKNDCVCATAMYNGEKVIVDETGACNKPLPFVLKPATEESLNHIAVDLKTLRIEYHSRNIGGPRIIEKK